MAQLFQLFLLASFVPAAWKRTTIIPVPKKPHVKAMNDFRPMALTSILCKYMERMVAKELISMVGESLDLLQFAHRARRGEALFLDAALFHVTSSLYCVFAVFLSPVFIFSDVCL